MTDKQTLVYMYVEAFKEMAGDMLHALLTTSGITVVACAVIAAYSLLSDMRERKQKAKDEHY